MDGINQFFSENIIPNVMVPNGVQQERLSDCLETIFLHLHPIDDFNKFLVAKALNGAF